MATDLTNVPQSFTVGETTIWTQALTDYPASAGTLVTTFINSTHKFAVTATASGDSHVSTISATTSAGLTKGIYSWQQKYTTTVGSIVTIVASGRTELLPSFSAATTLDTRTHAKTVLDAIEAVIAGRATEDHLSMSIAGRSISKMTLAELIQARDLYRREYALEVKAEKIARGEQPGGRIMVRFNNRGN